MNMTVTNNDLGGVIVERGNVRDELLTLAAADSIAAGTILARDSVSGKLVLFVKGGTTNENGIPKAILTYEVVTLAGGDVSTRAMLTGVVRFSKLIIDADGDNSNVDNAVMDQMRDYGLETETTAELNIADNQ